MTQSKTYPRFQMTTPFLPEMILKDGEDYTVVTNPYTQFSGVARKGTVAATLNNIARLNQLLLQKNHHEYEDSILSIVNAISQLIPSLVVVGLFDFFEPIYWIGQGEQPGRLVTLALYLKRYPEKNTAVLKNKLLSYTQAMTSPSLQALFHALT